MTQGEQLLLNFVPAKPLPREPRYPMIDTPVWRVNRKVHWRVGLDQLRMPDLDTYEGTPDQKDKKIDFSALTRNPYRRLVSYPIHTVGRRKLAPTLGRLGREGMLLGRDLIDEALEFLGSLGNAADVVDQMPVRAKIAGSWRVLSRVKRNVFRRASRAQELLARAYEHLCNGNVADCTMEMQVARTLFV